MEELPYIDEGIRPISVRPDEAWRALLSTIRLIGAWLPGPLIAVWGLEPSQRNGEWRSELRAGDTIVGFGVVEVTRPRLLVMRGGHRFSRYELRFELTEDGQGGTILHAHSSAVFPGVAGKLYRALVISSGGHRMAVRALLGQVAEQAATLYG